jgi:hypothetical protein
LRDPPKPSSNTHRNPKKFDKNRPSHHANAIKTPQRVRKLHRNMRIARAPPSEPSLKESTASLRLILQTFAGDLFQLGKAVAEGWANHTGG